MERNQYERSVLVNEITILNSQEFGNIRTQMAIDNCNMQMDLPLVDPS